MQLSIATKFIAACAVFSPANLVFAHEGRGLSGSHWHATDAWGFVALGVLIAVAAWLNRGGK